jgi:PPM family protein phosphatase
VTIRAVCPSCKQACRVPPELAGALVRCPGCQKPFTTAPPELSLRIATATSVGKARQRNEDAALVLQAAWSARGERHEAALVVVADGMGGHNAGDRASAVAIGAVAAALAPRLAAFASGEPWSDDLAEAVDLALWEANRAILRVADEEEGCHGMGATAVAVLLLDGKAALCHVGDCRAYLLSGGTLSLLTEDQTLARRMLAMGTITEAELERHEAGGQVAQALGRQYDLEPSRRLLSLAAGDVLLLCCDGLHGQVSDEAIKPVLAGDDAAARLVRMADDAGGQDNCTVAIVRV